MHNQFSIGDQHDPENSCILVDQTSQYIELSRLEQGKILQFQQEVLKLVALGYECGEICEKLCLLEEQLVPNSVASVMLLDDAGECLNVYVATSRRNLPAKRFKARALRRLLW